MKALDNRVYVKFMQLEIGLLLLSRLNWTKEYQMTRSLSTIFLVKPSEKMIQVVIVTAIFAFTIRKTCL